MPLVIRRNKLRYSSVKEYGVCNLFANGLAKQEFMSMWASTYVYSKILAMGESGWRVRGWSPNLSGRIPIDVCFVFFFNEIGKQSIYQQRGTFTFFSYLLFAVPVLNQSLCLSRYRFEGRCQLVEINPETGAISTGWVGQRGCRACEEQHVHSPHHSHWQRWGHPYHRVFAASRS